ncbi:MAG: hypothetical protein H6753_01085 [Candidatus Omnitrophica bacterium]|nr:hypothetical protein [Candidatus Omnitrophota bacterium]
MKIWIAVLFFSIGFTSLAYAGPSQEILRGIATSKVIKGDIVSIEGNKVTIREKTVVKDKLVLVNPRIIKSIKVGDYVRVNVLQNGSNVTNLEKLN